MNAKELMKGSLITLLNRSLDRQAITDVRVTGLSDDYRTARVSHVRRDGRTVRGAVSAEIICSGPAPVR